MARWRFGVSPLHGWRRQSQTRKAVDANVRVFPYYPSSIDSTLYSRGLYRWQTVCNLKRGAVEILPRQLQGFLAMLCHTYVWHLWGIKNSIQCAWLRCLIVIVIICSPSKNQEPRYRVSCGPWCLEAWRQVEYIKKLFTELSDFSSASLRDSKFIDWCFRSLTLSGATGYVMLETNPQYTLPNSMEDQSLVMLDGSLILRKASVVCDAIQDVQSG